MIGNLAMDLCYRWPDKRSKSHLGDKVRVSDDGAHEEAIVRDLCPRLHAGGAQVQVHLVVGAGHGPQGEVTHAVQLQLEGQRRLQVSVDAILLKLVLRKEVSLCSYLRPKFLNLPTGWYFLIFWWVL